MIARVVVIPAAGDTGPLDYVVDPPLEPAVRAGARVLVPLGSRRAVGIVTELATSSSHPRLKKILAALDPQPMLDESLLQLCRWMADYYLSSLADALSTALPGTARVHVERVARLLTTSDRSEPPTLSDAEQQVVSWLATNGPQTIAAIGEYVGARARRALQTLQRKGVIGVEEHLRGGSDETGTLLYSQSGARRDPCARVAGETAGAVLDLCLSPPASLGSRPRPRARHHVSRRIGKTGCPDQSRTGVGI